MLAALRGTASVGASSRLTGRRRLAVQAGQTPCLSRRSCVAGTGGVWPAAAQLQQQQRRHESAHAISNPTLAGIEKRWEEMPPQEQANLWMALRDRMKTDWKELTAHEKKAGRRAAPRCDAREGAGSTGTANAQQRTGSRSARMALARSRRPTRPGRSSRRSRRRCSSRSPSSA